MDTAHPQMETIPWLRTWSADAYGPKYSSDYSIWGPLHPNHLRPWTLRLCA